MLQRIILALLALYFGVTTNAQPGYFYPDGGNMNPAIPTPATFLGYEIGTHHTRHDKLVEYFKELDRLSDRVSVQIIGESYEHRQQVAAIFTSAANHSKLEEIRKAHLAGQVNRIDPICSASHSHGL